MLAFRGMAEHHGVHKRLPIALQPPAYLICNTEKGRRNTRCVSAAHIGNVNVPVPRLSAVRYAAASSSLLAKTRAASLCVVRCTSRRAGMSSASKLIILSTPKAKVSHQMP